MDDLLIAAKSTKCTHAILDELESKFALKRQGDIQYMLGIQVSRNEDGTVHLCQRTFIEKILERFGMSNCSPQPTPESGIDESWYDESQTPIDQSLYRSMIGSLVYAMTCTRPDICHAVQQLSRFLDKPIEVHFKAAKRVFRYLQGTKSIGLQYQRSTNLIGYSDASFAGDLEGRKSTSGYLWLMGGTPICCKSKLQSIVAKSSCEAEFTAYAESASEGVWVNSIIEFITNATPIPASMSMKPTIDPIVLHVDNQGAIHLAENRVINDI